MIVVWVGLGETARVRGAKKTHHHHHGAHRHRHRRRTGNETTLNEGLRTAEENEHKQMEVGICVAITGLAITGLELGLGLVAITGLAITGLELGLGQVTRQRSTKD